ncbi:MAG TPA: hypothetical protein P5048_01170 [Chlamydiales bacterium]|mgnify:CR=1 FL=1|nr:hypothetical protein [Chlamydiales bacterium]
MALVNSITLKNILPLVHEDHLLSLHQKTIHHVVMTSLENTRLSRQDHDEQKLIDSIRRRNIQVTHIEPQYRKRSL